MSKGVKKSENDKKLGISFQCLGAATEKALSSNSYQDSCQDSNSNSYQDAHKHFRINSYQASCQDSPSKF